MFRFGLACRGLVGFDFVCLFGNAVWLLFGFCGFGCGWLVLDLVLGLCFVSGVSCLLWFLVCVGCCTIGPVV